MRNIAPSLFLLAAVSACAGTITSGMGDRFGASISVQFRGSDFIAGASAISSEYPCGRPDGPCLPGTKIRSVLAGLSSEDRGASGGITFGNDSGSPSCDFSGIPGSRASVDVEFMFDLTTPGTNPPSSVTLTGPFTARAFFENPACPVGSFFSFAGQGIVTADLTLGTSGYDLPRLHFDFTSVPEPATGAVVFVAILAAVSCRSRGRLSSLNGLLTRAAQ